MANLTDAHGEYVFDFTNTPLASNPQGKKDFISGLDNIVSQFGNGGFVQFYTDFDMERLQSLTCDTPEISVPFGGCGRWAYMCNIRWYSTDEVLREYLSQCVGLVVTINYKEYDASELFDVTARLTVLPDKVRINTIQETVYNATPNLVVEFGFYDDVDDFFDANEDFFD